ncbi:MAG TPA: glycoside hydrolase family 88 protein [Candidatus Paenibacillus intestinavium]|nr:glycoside hydrolase family 88 protein [Candidatus Paenibacillus intestinavium]
MEDQHVLEVVANRYIGANPALPFVYRAFSASGILQNDEGLYLLDFTDTYSASANGSYAYALCLVWSDEERSIDGIIEPLGPTSLYLNEQKLYRSSVIEELKPDGRMSIPLLLLKGWNVIMIEARKTPAGFGCRFGADEGKVRILQVLSPFSNRAGQAGWSISEPCQSSLYGDHNNQFPQWEEADSTTGLQWFPRTQWTPSEQSLANLEKIYGFAHNVAAYGLTIVNIPTHIHSLSIELRTNGATIVWLGDDIVVNVEDAGNYTLDVDVSSKQGKHHIKVWSASGSQHWGFKLSVSNNGTILDLSAPISIHGYSKAWIYAGPFSSEVPALDNSPFVMSSLVKHHDDARYWNVDLPNTVVRPYYENAMLSNKWTVGNMSNFGRWDYPLGVTMYGLLRSGKQLDRADITEYALKHIRSCTDWYQYSLWDFKQYGFPSINHQLVLIKMLDNCGSFGSAMLEAYSITGDQTFADIAHVIADFMLNKLERKDDGAFFRTCEGDYSANTMWADDLYMSTPFLIRYAQLLGKKEALDEATKQFLLYRKYLFMEDQSIMSHVYDFKYNQATRVPWGRGNGWVLFSLSELLEKLPASHPDYNELAAFFRTFVKGVTSLQGVNGLWHQVLNESTSYEESSCTAMFVYAIARGIRMGWLDEHAVEYNAVVVQGWEALTKYAITRQGNVFGVCSGSRYSFAPDYYMYDLRTVVNDNHGIGIMMLAGVEVELLRQSHHYIGH